MPCRVLPDFVKELKRDPTGKGFLHLGKDGVLRTASSEYEVVDARGLTPEQIKTLLDILPFEEDQRRELQDVDGSLVTSHEALFHPAPGILPDKPTEEEAVQRRKLIEQQREKYLRARGKDSSES
ncbi:uncharacterized protein BDW43DRAFT_284178 [Aspergillus alliaceus]|uniref:uncharacterized protein n=1 Tax=Petromyces alliaceus TaxID=209559 RepID=UPI0012A62416|nr:uncharacterized protein BDW43DRAFT_284178 [Aspergillus alliaceus]KAB8230870.1 hypothetical protein BDW43DRAFT_284178 [Aspergillus alliaceus]